jgi:hypothetical protein
MRATVNNLNAKACNFGAFEKPISRKRKPDRCQVALILTPRAARPGATQGDISRIEIMRVTRTPRGTAVLVAFEPLCIVSEQEHLSSLDLNGRQLMLGRSAQANRGQFDRKGAKALGEVG